MLLRRFLSFLLGGVLMCFMPDGPPRAGLFRTEKGNKKMWWAGQEPRFFVTL